MRKLLISLIALAVWISPVIAQWGIDETVGVAGSDPARPKAGAVQGVTGGKPVPVEGGVSVVGPALDALQGIDAGVTTLNTSNDNIDAGVTTLNSTATDIKTATEGTDAGVTTANATLDTIKDAGVSTNTKIHDTGTSAQNTQGGVAAGGTTTGLNPYSIGGEDDTGFVDWYRQCLGGFPMLDHTTSIGDSFGSNLSLRAFWNSECGVGIGAVHGMLWDGAAWDRWYGDSTNGAFVNVKTSVLPTGAATEATLALVSTEATLAAMSAVVATAANQVIANASLSSIDGGIPAALGQTIMSASMPMVIASDQSPITVVGSTGGTMGVLDANNSTTTPLGIGAVFTGTATEVINYSHIGVFAIADEDSAANGGVIEFSDDGSTWPTAGSTLHTFTVDADNSRTFQAGPEARYFRVKYTNGGTAQTSFVLQTILRPNISHDTLHRIDDTITGDRSVRLVKAVLAGKTPGGSYVNVELTTGGNLKVAIEEFDASLPAGTNNIGDIDVLSLPSIPAGTNNIGDFDLASSIPAGSNNIGDFDLASSIPAGSNNMGDVDVLSLPSIPAGSNNIGDFDLASALPAGSNDIGFVNIKSGTAIDHGAVVVGSGAPVLILASASTTREVTIINSFTDLVAIGNSDVTLNSADATDGWVLAVSGAAGDGSGGSYTFKTSAALYGKGTSAGSKVIYIVESD